MAITDLKVNFNYFQNAVYTCPPYSSLTSTLPNRLVLVIMRSVAAVQQKRLGWSLWADYKFVAFARIAQYIRHKIYHEWLEVFVVFEILLKIRNTTTYLGRQ